MESQDYFIERSRSTNTKVTTLLDELPEFAEDYFISIEQNTSPLTRYNYAVDLLIFFDYLTKNVRAFKNLEAFRLTVKDMEYVTAQHIERFLSYLTQYEYHGKKHFNDEKGKARKLSSVKSLFRYLYTRDLLPNNVANKVASPKLHKKEIIRLDSDETEAILENAEIDEKFATAQQDHYNINTKDRDIAILTLLLGTGIRVSELVGLNVEDIDMKKQQFVVTRKGGNRSVLYFSDEVAEALDLWLRRRAKIMKKLENSDEKALFLSLQKKRMCVRSVELLVKKHAAIAAPLKKITPHKLRSTFGTQLYEVTGDIYAVAEVLGHKNIATTVAHYAASSEKIKKDASDKVRLKKR